MTTKVVQPLMSWIDIKEMQEISAATAPPPYLSQLLQKELSPTSFHNAALSSSVFFLPYSFLLHQSANAFLSRHLAVPAFIFFIQRLQQTYLALVLQIALVSCNHYGNVISAPDAVNEFLVCNNFIEAASISDGVTNDKSLSFAHVLLSHSCKLWLKRQKKTKNQEIMNWDFILCGSGRGCEDIIEVGNRANNNANKSKSQALPKKSIKKKIPRWHMSRWDCTSLHMECLLSKSACMQVHPSASV